MNASVRVSGLLCDILVRVAGIEYSVKFSDWVLYQGGGSQCNHL